jgi:cobalt transporter subunit CbtB
MEALNIMAQSAAANGPAATAVALPVIPVRELLPWAIFAMVIGALLIYFVGAEEGATSVFGGTFVHEFVHDGRHLLGFPCH